MRQSWLRPTKTIRSTPEGQTHGHSLPAVRGSECCHAHSRSTDSSSAAGGRLRVKQIGEYLDHWLTFDYTAEHRAREERMLELISKSLGSDTKLAITRILRGLGTEANTERPEGAS